MLRCSFRFNIRCCFLLSSLSVFLLRLIVRLLLKLLISPLPVRLKLRLAELRTYERHDHPDRNLRVFLPDKALYQRDRKRNVCQDRAGYRNLF